MTEQQPLTRPSLSLAGFQLGTLPSEPRYQEWKPVHSQQLPMAQQAALSWPAQGISLSTLVDTWANIQNPAQAAAIGSTLG